MTKKIFAMILATALCLPLCIPAFASESDTITIEEYERAINEEGLKNGVRCEVLSYDENKEITHDMLIRGLESIRAFAESRSVVFSSENNALIYNPITPLSPVPSTMTRDTTFRISCLYGAAIIRVQAEAIVDINSGAIMSVNSITAEPYYSYINLKSWTLKSITYQKNCPSTGSLKVHVVGVANFSYADPITGIDTGYIWDVDQYVYINYL